MEKEFKTFDYGLAVTLLTLGFDLKGLERSTPTRSKFVFEETKKLTDAINKFWKKELRVEPRAYFDAQRVVKSRLFSEME